MAEVYKVKVLTRVSHEVVYETPCIIDLELAEEIRGVIMKRRGILDANEVGMELAKNGYEEAQIAAAIVKLIPLSVQVFTLPVVRSLTEYEEKFDPTEELK